MMSTYPLAFLLAAFVPLVPVARLDVPFSRCSPCKCSLQYSADLDRKVYGANCHNRGLENLPGGIPHVVRALDLSYNKLPSESLKKLQNYKSLLSLSLASCGLKSLPDYVFASLKHLRILNLSGNDLTSVDRATLNGLSSLRYLIGLESQYIQGGSFQDLQQLREIHLTIHQENVPEDLLVGLQIRKLSMNVVSGNTVPANIFRISNDSLKEIILKGPMLKTLPDNLFYGLLMLQTVSIFAPNLGIIPESSFKGSGFSNLTLGKSKNQLHSAPSNLASVTLLGIRVIPPGLFEHQQSMETLKMSQIGEIPADIFTHLPTLNSLDVSESNLTGVPILGALSGVKTLNMSKTELKKLKSWTFSGLHSLQTLDLSFNRLTKIPRNVFQDVGITLQHLNLSNNDMVKIDPRAFDKVLSLKSLDLSNNNLISISPIQFWSLRNLHTLALSNNDIEALHWGLFSQQVDLVYLNLSTNVLKALPNGIFNNTFSLRFLDMSYNKLTSLPTDTRQAFDLLLLDGNPINCDCSLYNTLSSILMSEIEGKCSTPAELKKAFLRELNLSSSCVITTTATTTIQTTQEITTTTPTTFPATTRMLPTTKVTSVYSRSTTDPQRKTTQKPLLLNVLQRTTKLVPTAGKHRIKTWLQMDIEVKEKYSMRGYDQLQSDTDYLGKPWFLVVLSLSSGALGVIILAGCIRCARVQRRSRVYVVNTSEKQ